MLTIINSMKELAFSELMAVYEETNQKDGRERWPQDTQARQIAQAEQDFYNYLRSCFFPIASSRYFAWQVCGKYVSALRVEPYRDGLLLAGLETAPAQRGKGYASLLVASTLEWQREQGGSKVYSHIENRNFASVAVHEKCGFRKVSEFATYADGSVSHQAATYLYEI